jgi:RNA binding exosome subunit
MPKTTHQIKLKVFSYEKNNDNNKLILDKLLQLFPFNLEDEKIELNEKNVMGLNENKMTIFEVILKKEKHISKFLENLMKNIDDKDKKIILSQIESRLDNNLDFFLRFDKDEYIKNDKLRLTDSGNCFHIEMSIAAFPKKRELALGIVKEVFG